MQINALLSKAIRDSLIGKSLIIDEFSRNNRPQFKVRGNHGFDTDTSGKVVAVEHEWIRNESNQQVKAEIPVFYVTSFNAKIIDVSDVYASSDYDDAWISVNLTTDHDRAVSVSFIFYYESE